MTSQDIWRELAESWVRSHGTRGFDPLQGDRWNRFVESAPELRLPRWSSDASSAAHLAPATLDALAQGVITAEERDITERQLNQHLAACWDCSCALRSRRQGLASRRIGQAAGLVAQGKPIAVELDVDFTRSALVGLFAWQVESPLVTGSVVGAVSVLGGSAYLDLDRLDVALAGQPLVTSFSLVLAQEAGAGALLECAAAEVHASAKIDGQPEGLRWTLVPALRAQNFPPPMAYFVAESAMPGTLVWTGSLRPHETEEKESPLPTDVLNPQTQNRPFQMPHRWSEPAASNGIPESAFAGPLLAEATLVQWMGAALCDDSPLCSASATGTAGGFPPYVVLNENLFRGRRVELTFSRDGQGRGWLVGLEGCDEPALRKRLRLTVEYSDNSRQSFEGEAIASGGCWLLRDNDKPVARLILVMDGSD